MSPVVSENVSEKEIVGGYAIAAATLFLGLYFALRVSDPHIEPFMVRLFALVAALVILKYTFAWGRRRGFPVRRPDGTIVLENLLRNLVAAAIVFFCLSLLVAPFKVPPVQQ